MTHLPPATSGGTLRERFVADMVVRGFTDKTRKDYIRTVTGFAAFLERSPSTATAEDIRRFQIQQSERGMNAPAMNSAVAYVESCRFNLAECSLTLLPDSSAALSNMLKVPVFLYGCRLGRIAHRVAG